MFAMRAALCNSCFIGRKRTKGAKDEPAWAISASKVGYFDYSDHVAFEWMWRSFTDARRDSHSTCITYFNPHTTTRSSGRFATADNCSTSYKFSSPRHHGAKPHG
jgi:hypothetical protein